MVWSRTVSQDIREYVDNNGIDRGIDRLYNFNYYGKYPNGVMNQSWYSKTHHNWIDNERGTNFSIPNLVATHESSLMLNEGETLLITTEDSYLDNNTINLRLTLFKGNDPIKDVGIQLEPTQDGGFVIFGLGGGDGDDLTVPVAPDGSFDILDGLPLIPIGGGGGKLFNTHRISPGDFITWLGTIMGFMEEVAPSGNGSSSSDLTEKVQDKKATIDSTTWEARGNRRHIFENDFERGTNHLSDGTKEDTIRYRKETVTKENKKNKTKTTRYEWTDKKQEN